MVGGRLAISTYVFDVSWATRWMAEICSASKFVLKPMHFQLVRGLRMCSRIEVEAMSRIRRWRRSVMSWRRKRRSFLNTAVRLFARFGSHMTRDELDRSRYSRGVASQSRSCVSALIDDRREYWIFMLEVLAFAFALRAKKSEPPPGVFG